MKFKRLDENSIRCIISREEMDKHGIGIDDLMDDRNKAETFLRYVLQEADEELNFKTDSDSLNVQLSIMPSGDVSLMISDDTQSAMKNMISQFKDSVKDFAKLLKEKGEDAGESQGIDTKDKDEKSVDDVAQDMIAVENDIDGDTVMTTTIWMEYDNLEDMIRLTKITPELLEEESNLYKYRGIYYLTLHVTMPRKDVARLAFAFGEYCSKMYYENKEAFTILEHGKTLIQKNAFWALSQM